MLTKIRLIFGTVVHLKRIQIAYQLYYKFRKKLIAPLRYANLKDYKAPKRHLDFKHEQLYGEGLLVNVAPGTIAFTFLNQTHQFEFNKVDWNFQGHGKLWTYNLNYFEFLFHPNLKQSDGLMLIRNYAQNLSNHIDGLEPYPISLRGINWVKYLSKHKIREEQIDQSLFRQYRLLLANLEYHILGNHLLENAFSLLYGSYYFKNEEFRKVANRLLKAQLEEQILRDGAHFERSPMYHQIILFRVLDGINLLEHNNWKSEELLSFLKVKAQLMLNWLSTISEDLDGIPMVKDAAPGIAPGNKSLYSYARNLGLTWENPHLLSDSGYRMLRAGEMQMFVDVGGIAPAYQPGHAHADEGNFLIWKSAKPIIVDMGISTYEKSPRRQLERSTSSHNCVHIEGQNSSQVWGGFRVAKRARVDLIEETPDRLKMTHNGFDSFGTEVSRVFEVDEQGFYVADYINDKNSRGNELGLNLHFHPSVDVVIQGHEILADGINISLTGFYDFVLEDYMFAYGFNQLEKARRLRLKPTNESRISIRHAD